MQGYGKEAARENQVEINSLTLELGWRSLADKASASRNYLGWIINQYMHANGYIDVQLAEALQCDLDAINKLRVCATPKEESFVSDIKTIADFVGCNNIRLLRIIREVNAVEGMRKNEEAGEEEGFLMAARDFWGDNDDEPE